MTSEVIQELKGEHQSFLKKLEKIFQKTQESGFFEDLMSLSLFRTEFLQLNHEVSSRHHEKEERLFEALIANPIANQGGPRCNYFMQQKMMNDYTKKVDDFWKEYTELKLEKDALLVEAQTKGSALSIPLEEHYYLRKLVFMISFEVNLQMQAIDNYRSARIKDLFNLYKAMLMSHIEKEDQCLFVVLEKLTA